MSPPAPLHGASGASDPRSDAELFGAITKGGNGVRRAQEALYQRHARYLYGALQKQRQRLLRIAGLSVDDVLQDTFQRAFERASGFAGDPELDPDRARRRTRAWLGRIAHNLVTDSFRKVREVSASDYLEQVAMPANDAGPPSSRPDLEPVRSALGELSDREQDILRVSALYFKAEGRGRLPNAVSEELGKRWGISNDNVRAIRSRALKKLRAALTAERPSAPQEKSP